MRTTRLLNASAALLALAVTTGCPTATGQPSRRAIPPPNKLSGAQALARLEAERDLFWLNAQKEVHRSVPELFAQHEAELERGLRTNTLLMGDPKKKQIALTFDDGPHPGYTPRILAILRKYRVPATFFLVGEKAEQYPDLVRAEVADGHSVGNHTYHHFSLPKIPDAYVPDEIKACGDVIRNITGQAPHLFRPPGGEYDREIAEAAEALGYILVLWTDDPGDYASPGERVILERTMRKAGPGGILLIHDGIEQTVDILPQIILNLQTRGYTFVTVDEMLAGRRSPGKRTKP